MSKYDLKKLDEFTYFQDLNDYVDTILISEGILDSEPCYYEVAWDVKDKNIEMAKFLAAAHRAEDKLLQSSKRRATLQGLASTISRLRNESNPVENHPFLDEHAKDWEESIALLHKLSNSMLSFDGVERFFNDLKRLEK